MGVRERMLALRLKEKLDTNFEYAKKIGVEVVVNLNGEDSRFEAGDSCIR